MWKKKKCNILVTTDGTNRFWYNWRNIIIWMLCEQWYVNYSKTHTLDLFQYTRVWDPVCWNKTGNFSLSSLHILLCHCCWQDWPQDNKLFTQHDHVVGYPQRMYISFFPNGNHFCFDTRGKWRHTKDLPMPELSAPPPRPPSNCIASQFHMTRWDLCNDQNEYGPY